MNPPNNNVEYWACATIKDGKVFGIVEGFPAGTLAENDIQITKEEFNLLRILLPHYRDMRNLKRLARSLEAKIINQIKDMV